MNRHERQAAEIVERMITKCGVLTMLTRLLNLIFGLGASIVAVRSYWSGDRPSSGALVVMTLVFAFAIVTLLEFTLHTTRRSLSKLRGCQSNSVGAVDSEASQE